MKHLNLVYLIEKFNSNLYRSPKIETDTRNIVRTRQQEDCPWEWWEGKGKNLL